MNRLFYLLAALLLILTGCKKDSAGSSTPALLPALGTITAEVDGVATTFDTSAMAILTTQAWATMDISGYEGKADSTNEINFEIAIQDTPFVAGSYYDSTINPNPNNLGSLIGYHQQPNNIFYQSNGTAPFTGEVTITSISDTTIAGTFRGQVSIVNGTGSPASHNITNGQFNVRIQ